MAFPNLIKIAYGLLENKQQQTIPVQSKTPHDGVDSFRFSRTKRDLAHRIGGEIRKEFYVDSLFNILYESDPAKKSGSSSKLLPETGSGAGFCVNDTAAKAAAAGGAANCDPDVKGGYWKGGSSGEMTLCAACCREKDFGYLPVGKKVVYTGTYC